MKNKIYSLKHLVNWLSDGLKLRLFKLMFWKPDLIWLYRNRYLRMDANQQINDKKRREFHLDRYEFSCNYLKSLNKEGLFILDAACGTGYGCDVLKRLNHELIVGIDIDPKTIRYANKKYGSDKCVFKVSDVVCMEGFKNDMFDAVVSFETIEHLEQPIIFLEKINKILKQKGILIISTPNKWGISKHHKFDYDYNLLRGHLDKYFSIIDIYIHNSGSIELYTNRGCKHRLEKANSNNIEEAECFIAVCKKQ